MSKIDQYNLEFHKKHVPGFSTKYVCSQSTVTAENQYLCGLLNTLGKREGVSLLHEVNKAISGNLYEEFYTVDGAMFNDGVQLVPPNAIINQEFQVPLLELRGVLEEWNMFCNS